MSEVAERTALTPYQEVSQALEARRPHFKQLLGSDEATARFMRVVLLATQSNPRLLQAERRSLLLACMKAATDGLMPDGREAVLNMYGDKAQYLPMVGGMIKKLWQSGLFDMLDGVAVYERDHFVYRRGDDPRIEHVPYDGPEDPGKIKAAYFIARMKSGDIKREVMWRRDIEKVRAASKAADGLMWSTYYDQGAIKSVIRRAFKQLPSTPALDQLMSHDNEADAAPLSSLEAETPTAAAGPRGGVATPGAPVSVQQDAPVAAAGGRLRKTLEARRKAPREEDNRPPADVSLGDPPMAEAPTSAEPPAQLWEPSSEEVEAIRQREIDESRST